jgi:hypothetical protein
MSKGTYVNAMHGSVKVCFALLFQSTVLSAEECAFKIFCGMPKQFQVHQSEYGSMSVIKCVRWAVCIHVWEAMIHEHMDHLVCHGVKQYLSHTHTHIHIATHESFALFSSHQCLCVAILHSHYTSSRVVQHDNGMLRSSPAV